MLFWSNKMSQSHSLDNNLLYQIAIDNKPVERVEGGMESLRNAVSGEYELGCSYQTVTPCYKKLAVLKHLRRFSPYAVKKNFAETLILSKLDY